MKKTTPSLWAFSLSVLVLVACSSASFAGGDDENKGKGKAGQNGQRRAAAGQRAQGGPGQQGNRPQMDPARVVAKMMQEFDADGDQKLNIQELTALLTQMRQRGGQGGARGGMRGNQDGNAVGQAARGKGKRPGGAQQQDNPGGQKPKRPSAT